MSEARSSKSEILSAIRKHLAESVTRDLVHAEHAQISASASDPGVRAARATNSKLPVDTFCENLESVGGKWGLAHSVAEASSILQFMIDRLSPRRIALSDSPMIIRLLDSVTTKAEVLSKAAASELFGCDVGITSAQWGIAETGTLVLDSGKEFNRLASLVPEVHICILDAANIRDKMRDILELLNHELSPAVTFVTGPSRTSDIELTLAIGVHGPRELNVIITDLEETRSGLTSVD